MSEFSSLVLKLERDYPKNLVDDIVESYKSHPKKLLYNFHTIKRGLYNIVRTSSTYWPDWIKDLPYERLKVEDPSDKLYAVDLFTTHDMILEECTDRVAIKLNERILKELYDNYVNKIPLFIQLRFFQDLKLVEPIKESDIIMYFGGQFVKRCREIYKKHREFKQDYFKGLTLVKEL